MSLFLLNLAKPKSWLNPYTNNETVSNLLTATTVSATYGVFQNIIAPTVSYNTVQCTTLTASVGYINTATIGVALEFNNATNLYIPAPLNYYEEFTGTGQTSGAFTATCTYSIIRIGKVVNYKMSTNLAGTFTAAALTFPQPDPRFVTLGGNTWNYPINVKDAGTYKVFNLELFQNNIGIVANLDGGAFTGGANSSCGAFSISWTLV